MPNTSRKHLTKVRKNSCRHRQNISQKKWAISRWYAGASSGCFNNENMNEKNFEYLKKLLENLGFGNKLNGVLQQALEKGFNTFTLGLNNSYLSEEAKILGTSNKDIVKYRLNFTKSKNS